jgi:hypothetical protein
MDVEKSSGGSSRRTVLKSVGVGTLGFGGLSNAGVVVGASERTTRIGILAEGDEIVREVKVPKRWKQQAEQAARAKRQISNSVGRRSDVHTVGVGNQESTIDGLKKHTVDVQVDPDGDTSGIPDEVNGIPVVVGKSGRSQATCYTQDKSSIFGGLSSSGPESDDSRGTLCCRVFKDGSKRMLGCRHLFITHSGDDEDYCEGDGPGDNTWHRAGERTGKIIDDYQRHDAVLMDTQFSDEPVTNDIPDDDGQITGRVTGNGLEYLKSNDKQVQKRGIATCVTSGEVSEIRQTIFCNDEDYIGGIVESTTEQKDGDSGGPVYYKEGTDLYLVSMAVARKSDTNSDAQGSSANDMYNDQGITFGGDPFSG